MPSGGRNDRAFIEREFDGDIEGGRDRNSYKNFDRDWCIRRHHRPCGSATTCYVLIAAIVGFVAFAAAAACSVAHLIKKTSESCFSDVLISYS